MWKQYHFTEQDFSAKACAQTSLLKLLEPLKSFYSESGARLSLGVTSTLYENDTIPMEAFARPLWGLVPFWAGGGKNEVFESIYRRGLAAGSNPKNPDYWHECHDYDQKFCEMAVIAYGMLFAPEQVWNPLSEQEKANLAEWLWEINRHECCACNWQWFAILTNLALYKCGQPYSKERMESGLAMLESYYDEGGWYNDGNGGEKDYYNPFVMVSYGLFYSIFMGKEEPERCAHFCQRAKEFAKDYIYWFSAEGPSIAYGRSMTYRFAQAAFFSISLLAGVEVLPLPVVKGILVRHLTWWLNQPIFDNAGVLTIGYAYPNLQMSESYNGPGSPYWALEAFAFLALPDDHPFWNAEAAPLPQLEKQKFLPNADMILQHGNGDAVALVPGRTQTDGHSHSIEKYSKFAYSAKYAFSIARSQMTLAELAPDSMLAFQVYGCCFVKNAAESTKISADGVVCSWSPIEGIQVTTHIVPNARGHLRIHEVTSNVDCTACDCGFAIPTDDRCEFSCKEQAAFAEVRSAGGYCKAEAGSANGCGKVLVPDPNTNLNAPKTAIPMVVYQIHKGTQELRTQITYFEQE